MISQELYSNKSDRKCAVILNLAVKIREAVARLTAVQFVTFVINQVTQLQLVDSDKIRVGTQEFQMHRVGQPRVGDARNTRVIQEIKI